jgi:hypothetical protein
MALPLMQKGYEHHKNKLGLYNIDVCLLANNLAMLYRCLDRYSEARALWEEILRVERKVFGEKQFHTLKTIYDLGELHYSNGYFAEAAVLFEEYLSKKKTATADDPDTISSVKSKLKRCQSVMARKK